MYTRKYFIRLIGFAFMFCLSCSSYKRMSMFSDNTTIIGMSKDSFIRKYGKPFSADVKTVDGKIYETLYYKEELFKGCWYIVTTAARFEDGIFVEQTVQEERQYSSFGDVEKM